MQEYNQHAQNIIKTLNDSSPSVCSIEAGPFLFHYTIENGVCFMTLAERGYPRRLAFQYLEELQTAFNQLHGHKVHTFDRPYGAMDFQPKMNRLRRDFLDPRSPKNVEKLNSNLTEIHNIMCANIQEVLHRGRALDDVQNMSEQLVSESKRYQSHAKKINLQYMWRTMGPIVAVVLVILFVLYLRFFR
eukprot:TRINITY_DN113486_c0_g1_i1.p2 TRINITY_DN113486_c0_g1~~TRINITY_DN113486_c0_g1_i1.p2  ORF type:complete len:221 (-),score=90.73 TRINITY_DN113486_c0_g1_i1:32-595(-)